MSAPTPFDQDLYTWACLEMKRKPGEDFDTYNKRQDAAFEQLTRYDRRSGPGLNAGRMVQFPAADGYAHYIISRVGVTNCTLLHIPYGDGYSHDAVGDDGICRLDVVRRIIARADSLQTHFDRQQADRDQFKQSLVPGETIYYRGTDGWIRGIVTPDRSVRPMALLGVARDPKVKQVRNSTRPRAYTISRTGKVSYSYEAQKVKDGELCNPDPKAVWGPAYAMDGGISAPGVANPAALAEFPIEPPPTTPQQELIYAAWRNLEEVVLILEPVSYDGNRVSPIACPIERMKVASRRLSEVLSRLD